MDSHKSQHGTLQSSENLPTSQSLQDETTESNSISRKVSGNIVSVPSRVLVLKKHQRKCCCKKKPEEEMTIIDDQKYRDGGTDYYPSLHHHHASVPKGDGVHGRNHKKRRKTIPNRPNISLNLWKLFRNSLGKDLARIPIPVNFLEPLSMLQRLTEQYEYSEILDAAAKCGNSSEEFCLVVAFTVSAFSTISDRPAKPFNPLLGETFECDRSDDKGWRYLSEQVRHYPPTLAQHCKGRGWEMWQDVTVKIKFRGTYLEVYHLGNSHIHIKSSGNRYYFCSTQDNRVNSYVHNLYFGRFWVERSGTMEIFNEANGDKCILIYWPDTNDDEKKVTGMIVNKQGIISWSLEGFWNKYFQATPIKEQKLVDGKSDLSLKLVTKFGLPKRLWTRRLPPSSCEEYYFFTEFACQLNEPEEGVAPTDSRRRPDQRLMENGQWDEADTEKIRLEEKQRKLIHNGRLRHSTQPDTSPHEKYEGYDILWFNKEASAPNGLSSYIFDDTYWQHKEKSDWSKCPNIFGD